MAQLTKLLNIILKGTSDANIPFRELCSLLRRLGFEERIRGDHHIFTKDGVPEIVNIQPKGSKAKVLPGQADSWYHSEAQTRGARR